MIVTIHQPNFLPYSGFFHKLSLADTFVLLDNTQFQFDYTNRNKILKSDGSWTRISIPIKKHQKFLPIKDIEIDNTTPLGIPTVIPSTETSEEVDGYNQQGALNA